MPLPPSPSRSRSTLPEDVPLPALRRARLFRRLFLAFVALLVLAGASGWLGVKTETRKASGGDYALEVRYPRVIRPGLAGVWQLDIRKRGGFEAGATVRVRLNSKYFDLYDENGFDPDPVSTTTDGTYLIQQFEAPDHGDTLSLSFDARIEPGVQKGAKGEAAVLDDSGRPFSSISWTTTVVP